ncbi:sensor histidine kinase [Flavobacterium frigidarium]|uniref:histidine kinase n=1 Tax=Flavobacterium frigidarium TaxID=99286 RepID=A0ABV4KAK1_9FLAO
MRFTTILENIISNAVKYHNPAVRKRFIKISVSCNDVELVLTIEDNGVGIAPEFHEKIFEMFFRLPGEAEGSGIGLYIVKETVEKLHGNIQITSNLGQGTTLLIRLKNFKYD